MTLYEPDLLKCVIKEGDGVRTEGLGIIICLRVITVEDVDIIHDSINVNIATSPICTGGYM